MIRDATVDDIPALVELGALMHNESIYASYSYNTDKVAQQLRNLIESSLGIVVVSEQAGVIEGGFVGCVYPHWFGDDLSAFDYAIFLSPEHRRGTTAARLTKRFVEQAKDKGAKQIIIANSTGVEFERVGRLFESLGFEKRGYVFEYTRSV